MEPFVLEACVDSVESALAAELGGCTRFELCANLVIGGTSPSHALFRAVRGETETPINVLLRTRFGDFCYTTYEYAIMMEEAAWFLQEGANAVVCGFLTPEGELDVGRIQPMVEMAHAQGAKFTLHRAFDVCKDPFQALQACQDMGVDTILTSGQRATCLEGLDLLETLYAKREKVELLVGAGVNAAAIRQVRERIPQAISFHMSGKTVLESPMLYRNDKVSMGLPSLSEFQLWRTDAQEIQAARQALEEGDA